MKSISRTEAALSAAALLFILVTIFVSIFGLRGGDIRISSAPEAAAQRSRPAETASGLIDINTAPAEELSCLPGIGETLAARIVEYRETNGPFADIAALTEVDGIGNGKLAAIEGFIFASKEAIP